MAWVTIDARCTSAPLAFGFYLRQGHLLHGLKREQFKMFAHPLRSFVDVADDRCECLSNCGPVGSTYFQFQTENEHCPDHAHADASVKRNSRAFVWGLPAPRASPRRP